MPLIVARDATISAMPSASDTAYPRLKANPSATELGEIYAPNIFELVLPVT
jgi:hypothetical protein